MTEPTHRARVADIITIASYLWAVPPEQITGKRRERRYIRARFAVALVAKEQGYSLPQIGRSMNRDHSTVRHAALQAENYAMREPVYASAIARLREMARSAKPFVADRMAG